MSWHIYILASNSLKFLNYIYMNIESNKRLKIYNSIKYSQVLPIFNEFAKYPKFT